MQVTVDRLASQALFVLYRENNIAHHNDDLPPSILFIICPDSTPHNLIPQCHITSHHMSHPSCAIHAVYGDEKVTRRCSCTFGMCPCWCSEGSLCPPCRFCYEGLLKAVLRRGRHADQVGAYHSLPYNSIACRCQIRMIG